MNIVPLKPHLPVSYIDKKENLSLSQWMERRVLVYHCGRSMCVCHLQGDCMATAKRHDVERHFRMCNASYHAKHPPGRTLWAEEVQTAVFIFHQTSEKPKAASFRATHFLIKKTFSDGEVFNEAIMIIAKTGLKDKKYGTDVIHAHRCPTRSIYND